LLSCCSRSAAVVATTDIADGGPGGGIGIFGLVLIVLVLIYVFGGLRLP
jgi:hypothetical protein